MSRYQDEPELFLRALFQSALDAADPLKCVPPCLPERAEGRTVVVGAGKAAAVMAQAIEKHWAATYGELPEGVVVTRYGHAAPCERIEVLEASHPVPDKAGMAAAERILDIARGLGPDDLLICALSGGGSSLLTLPAAGIPFDDKQAVGRALLNSGATIAEINAVRKHLSAIKGGRLAAAAHPARVVSILISDVPSDDPSVIASGPTVADASNWDDVRRVVRDREIELPDSVAAFIEAAEEETPKPGDAVFEKSGVRMAATPLTSLEAAARLARSEGVTPVILGDAIEGASREVATVMAGIAKSVRAHCHPGAPPLVLLSGGETTAMQKGSGVGGPNAEFALALAQALHGAPGTWALACDTDGIDGGADVAGAIIGPDTLTQARAIGRDASEALRNSDSHGFFDALDAQVVTGPTLTNVNDFRAILVT